METLLFPLSEEINYIVLSKPHWDYIVKIFGGNPIQRIFVMDEKLE